MIIKKRNMVYGAMYKVLAGDIHLDRSKAGNWCKLDVTKYLELALAAHSVKSPAPPRN